MRGNEIGKGAVRRYARFLASHPFFVLAIFLIFTFFAGYHASMVEAAGISYKEILPEGVKVVDTLELIEDQFGSSMSRTTITVEAEPMYTRSDEIRDVRDPEVLRYVDLLAKKTKLVYGVVGAESAADVIKEANSGRIPSSLRSVKALLKKNELAKQRISDYISEDYSMTLVRLNILEGVDEEEVVAGLREAMNIEKPQGVSVDITGDAGSPVILVTTIELAQSTMVGTSFVSFAVIILILIIIFASIKHGLIPLLTIVFGAIWTFGTLVLAGFEVTPATSGALAMIMGIGIDFGIQVTKRFRYELKSQKREEAMVDTLNNVFYPMCITAIAAVIGFKSLSLAKLTVMADMGTMMAVGVVFCMVAALTVVPAVLVLFERKRR
jgi:predicted RND superfamily exporter protein